MKLFRVWDDYSQAETEKYFFDESNAKYYIGTRHYPINWEVDSVETQDEPLEDE